ncbi:MAG: CHAT domain-containing tetratricopeptide repeat protein [Bacteroidota bacterium]
MKFQIILLQVSLILICSFYAKNLKAINTTDSLANELYKVQQFQEAYEQYHLASQAYYESKQKNEWLRSKQRMVKCAVNGRFANADSVLKDAIQDAWWEDDQDIAKLYFLMGNGLLDRQNQPYDAIAAYEKALNIFFDSDFDAWDYFTQYRDFFKSKEHFLSLYIYQPLGRAYSNIGDGQQADYYSQQAEKYFIQYNTPDELATTYQNWSGSLWDQRKLSEALEKAELGLAIPVEAVAGSTRAALLANKAVYLLEMSRLPEQASDSLLREAFLCISQAIRFEKVPQRYQFYSILADVQEAKGEHLQAERSYLKALILAEEQPSPDQRILAKIHLGIAALKSMAGRYQEALHQCQLALHKILPDFAFNETHKLPAPDQLYLENVFLEALQQKVEIYRAMYAADPQKAYLQYARACIDLILLVEDLFVEAYNYESAQLQMVSESYGRHEQALHVLFELASQFGETECWDQFLQVMEKSQAIIFRQELNRARLSQMNKDSQKRYNQLQHQISQTRQSLATEQLVPSQEIKLKETLNALIRDKKVLSQTLANRFPSSQWALTHQQSSISAIQNYLRKQAKTLFLQYFWGEEQIYLLAIDVDTFKVEKIALSASFLDWQLVAEEMHRGSTVVNSVDDSTYFHVYTQNRLKGFQTLLAPGLISQAKHVIIVPSGPLVSLAPESFLTSIDTDTQIEYRSLPYFLRQADIRYVYSSDLLLYPVEYTSPVNQKSYIGFAPEYRSNDSLRSLSSGEGLVSSLADLFDGQAVLGEQAVDTVFLHWLRDQAYEMVHFHGHADSSRGSWLALSGSSYVSMNEIYGLSFWARLVILSGCFTGAGEMVNGEGSLHLGRSMQLAGSKNVVLSAWRADDQAAANIIKEYCSLLAEGVPLSEALRTAKLSYLDNGRYAHPYFWANFHLIGENETLEPQDRLDDSLSVKWLLIALALFGILVLARKRFFT